MYESATKNSAEDSFIITASFLATSTKVAGAMKGLAASTCLLIGTRAPFYKLVVSTCSQRAMWQCHRFCG